MEEILKQMTGIKPSSKQIFCFQKELNELGRWYQNAMENLHEHV
jgi:hypothetical protein